MTVAQDLSYKFSKRFRGNSITLYSVFRDRTNTYTTWHKIESITSAVAFKDNTIQVEGVARPIVSPFGHRKVFIEEGL